MYYLLLNKYLLEFLRNAALKEGMIVIKLTYQFLGHLLQFQTFEENSILR